MMERCLVVDDNVEFAENLAEILLSWCGEAVIATDPNSAIQLLASKPFDLLVSDLKMPLMDGLQLIRKAHQLQPKLLSVIVTAYANDHSLERALEEGCIAVLCKQPLPLEQLRTLIKQPAVH